ncbi:transcriptional attenuator, LytR family [Paenibacillus sp. UNC496MF]|uniref:LCP family glycopolymer transferase n=1 Tax=Paenibacillus sp. UNC496MF TaxID=1502753 RepID=UPI0008E58A18|nr:LCP family protein [Paenibacillus sp. UNC496MF]SFI88720.1 transcriptional attenuator, LytR family [Paenibacillus sp. UNC496MF]
MKKKMKRVFIWSGSAVALILIAAGAFTWYTYHSVKSTAAKMYEDLGPVKPVYVSKDTEVKKPAEPVKMKQLDPFTVLVLGVDQRAGDRGRSDTMIVLSVNPEKHNMLMFNIPRDTRTDIIGHHTVDKINHAYAFGGVQMSMATVENFLDYPIDYYVKVNMEGFARLIDLIGGVEVDNPFAFDYEGYSFKQGHLALNGAEALKYSRMRYDDPRGDFGRNSRQRDILQEIMNNAASVNNVVHLQSMLSELGDSVKTDVTFGEMKTFAADYRPQIKSIETVEIKGTGKIIDGIWYYLVDEKERARIHNELKAHMSKQTQLASK